MKPVCLSLMALLCSGCVSGPRRLDTFSGMEKPAVKEAFGSLAPTPKLQGRYKSLSVGVILSENSKRSAEGNKNNGGAAFRSVEYSPQALFDGYVRLLQDNFKSATRVESPEEARAAGLDLVAVLDLFYEYPQGIFTTAKCSVVVAFLKPDGTKVEAVRGEAAKHPRDTPGFLALPRMKQAVENSSAQCRAGVEKGLLESPALAALAGGAAPAPIVSVLRQPASDVDTPTYKQPERADDYALVIGIGQYKSLPAADYAARDAQAMKAHLIALGYPGRNVVLLEGADATRSGIQSYVEEWLPRNVKPSSRVFVYFSGHGAPETATGEAYLVPWDGDPKFLKTSAYSARQLYESLGRLKAPQIVVALDACFSGAGGRSVLPKGARPLVSKVDEGFSAASRLSVLAAAGGDEITGSLDEQGHGIFTYFLLKGLTAGKRSARELHEYSKPLVQEEARRQNREQTPTLHGPEAKL